MEVIIKNIEMPKNCDCCHFLHRIEQDDDHPAFYICQIESIGKPITHIPMSSIDIDKRQDWCPIEPVVHGHWIKKPLEETIGSGVPIYAMFCSVCDWMGNEIDNYCSNCGARMVDDK